MLLKSALENVAERLEPIFKNKQMALLNARVYLEGGGARKLEVES